MTSESSIQSFKSVIPTCCSKEIVSVDKRILIVSELNEASNKEFFFTSYRSFAEQFRLQGFEIIFLTLPYKNDSKKSPTTDFEKKLNDVRYLDGQGLLGEVCKSLSFNSIVQILDDIIGVYRPTAVIGLDDVTLQLAAITSSKKSELLYFQNYNSELKEDFFQQYIFKQFKLEPGLSVASINYIVKELGKTLQAGATADSSMAVVSNRNLIQKIVIDHKILTLKGNDEKNIVDITNVGNSFTLELKASVVYKLNSSAKTRKAVLLFDFFDERGQKVESIAGLGISSAFKKHFRYLNSNSQTIEANPLEVLKMSLPENVVGIAISVASMGLKDDEHIMLSISGRCYNEEAEKAHDLQQLQRQMLPKAIVHDPSAKRYTSDLTVASILDEFTSECLSHEVHLVGITQESWQAQIEKSSPDFLLVESCWKGNNGNWGTLTKGSGGGKKLSALLRYCKEKKIPTVFWNKEDPPHYEKFGPIAKLFDVAITTDINMVPRYKADFGIDAYPLSFGAQPKIHNPVRLIQRKPKAVFAGSYYGDKPKRCVDFNEVMSELKRAKVSFDIFDRNYQRNIEKFEFPKDYRDNIIGNLSPEEVWKAHKGYKYQVNMNSVQDSETMFARRVYESLASGTPVISNESIGVRELFGDVVIMPGERTISDQLGDLEKSPRAYEELARRGVRAVLREHTYGHRIQELCRLLGMNVEVDLPQVTLAVKVQSESDICEAQKLFASQTARRKRLFIELANFETAYKYLNKSDDNVIYAMEVARKFYTEDRDYYGSDKVLKHDLHMPLAPEALEDFLYWGDVKELSELFQESLKVEVEL